MRGKVFITGANGFLGRSTVSALEQDKWQVYKGLRSQTSNNSILLDLENPKEILELEHKYKFDTIIHLATKVGFNSVSSAELYIPNVLSTACLLFLAKQWNAKFIFASASIVCGVRSKLINSLSEIKADTPYGYSKWLAEELISASKVNSCILRFCGIFGDGGPSHLGLNRAIAQAKNKQLPQIIGEGKSRRNYIYVKDAATSIAASLSNNLQGMHFVAGSETLTISEMMHQLCEVFLPHQKPRSVSGRAATDQVVEPSLALPPSRSFREALQDIKKEMVE